MADQQPANPPATTPATPVNDNPATPGTSTPNPTVATQSIPTQTSPPGPTGQVIPQQQQMAQTTQQIQQQQPQHVHTTPTPPQPNPTPPQSAQSLTPQPQLQQQHITSQLQTIPMQSQSGLNALQMQQQATTLTSQMQLQQQQTALQQQQQQTALQQPAMQMQPQQQTTLMSQLQSQQHPVVSQGIHVPLQQVQQTTQALNTQLQTQLQPGAQQLAQMQAQQNLQGIQQFQAQNAAGQATMSQLAATPAGAVMRSSLPQVQLIQQPATFLQQQQQQLIYAAAVQAAMQQAQQGLGGQQISLGTLQTRVTTPTAKSPALVTVSQGIQTAQRSLAQQSTGVQTTKVSMANSRPLAAVQQQQTVFNQKQLLQRPGQQPLVIGQLGVLTNQALPVGSSQLNQGNKSQGVTMTSGNHAALLANQPLRLAQTTYVTNTGQLVNSNGQLITGNQAMLGQLQAMTIQQSNLQPLANQQMLSNQGTAILSTRPVYIQAATHLQAQQGIVGNIQAVAPTKGVAVSKAGVEVAATIKPNQPTQPKTIATPGQVVKGVQQILPQPPRPGLSQAATKPAQQTLQVHPTNISLQTNASRQVQVNARQVSRVQAIKAGRIARPVLNIVTATPTASTQTVTTATVMQPRIAPQPTGQVRVSPQLVTSQPPTLVVQPKRQEQPEVEQCDSPPPPVAIVPLGVRVSPVPAAADPEPSSPLHSPVGTTEEALHMNGDVSQSELISQVDSGRDDDDDDDDDDDREREDDQEGEDADEEDMDTEDQADLITEGSKVVKANPGEVNGRHPDDDKDDDGQGEKQKAIVRPQVLTHVIEGFIIQEAREPFPVQRSSVMNEFLGNKPPPPPDPDESMDMGDRDGSLADFDDENLDLLPCDRAGTPDSDEDKKLALVERKRRIEEARVDPTVKLRCEFCCKEDYPYRFKRSKRFCSMACAKRYNVGCSRHIPAPTIGFSAPSSDESPASPMPSTEHASSPTESVPPSSLPKSTSPVPGMIGSLGHGEPSSESESSLTPSGINESSSPSSPPELERVVEVEMPSMQEDPPPPTQKYIREWNTHEVYQFIHTLPGCTMYADEFSRQEIDGQALMLLKEDHLMTAMNIKLGPALKICAKINTLREEGS